MKKAIIAMFCLISLLCISTTVFAEKTTLYALDGRTLLVDENQIAVYTAEGMGWFLEKPVTMYSADGRTIVVPADRVEAQKAVGWFVKEEQPVPAPPTEAPQTPENSQPTTTGDAVIKYTDGTIIRVPEAHVSMYKTLGWEKVNPQFNQFGNVIIYNSEGDSREILFDEVEKYVKEGWLFAAPGTEVETPETPSMPSGENITIYHYDGSKKEINSNEYETYKAKSWGLTYDEAVYIYAVLGDGGENIGANSLLESKKYELAYRKIEDALTKIEAGNSQYVQMLYSLRSNVLKTWESAANSPLGFINYWFSDRNGKKVITFEYRNLSDKNITYIGLDFDICDGEGEVIETNAGYYYVNNLQLLPCNKARVTWAIKSGDLAKNIKNLKVKEVRFADGTSWKAAE